jgi:transcription initiation factor TFIIB
MSSKTIPSDRNTRRKKKNKKRKKLWKEFDNEVLNKDEDRMECLYRNAKVNQKDYCDLCNDRLLFSKEGFLVCSNEKCGIVYKNVLDEGAEWRYYGADDNNSRDPTRCGMPINPLLEESSYGCKVICRHGTSYEMKKIKRYTEWQSMPYKEKSQYDEFQRIKVMSKNAGIPKIMVDEALRQHKKISEMKTFRGCNRDSIIAKEIATIFHLNNSDSTKGCKNAMQLLNSIERDVESNSKTRLCKTKPTSFIERYCSRLNINKEITKVCLFVALNIQSNNIIPENTPHSVAAGIVYFVSQSCNLNITKKDVNNCSEISEVTINKCYKKLEKLKSKLIPPVILSKYSYL